MKSLFPFYLILFFCCVLFSTQIKAQTFEKVNGPYGGGSWNGGASKVYEGKNGLLFLIIKDYNSHQFLYRSDDGGINWFVLPDLPAHYNGDILDVGMDGNLFCSDGNKIFQSTTDGESWLTLNVPAGSRKIITVKSLPDGTILIGDYYKTYQSSDKGLNWNESSITDIDHFFYNNSNNETYAINSNTLFVSKDKGLSWQIFYTDNFGLFERKDILFPDNGNILISGSGFIWKLDSTGNLIKRLDPFPGTSRQIDMGLSVTGRLFAFKWFKSLYSDDLGETWIKLGSGGTDSAAYQSFTLTKSGVLFAIKHLGGVYRTLNNGNSWEFSAYGLNFATIVELDYLSASRILALTNDGLFYSADEGQSWTFLFASNEGVVAGRESNHLVVNHEEIYLLDYDSLFYFKDWKSSPVATYLGDNPGNDVKLFASASTGSLFYGGSGFYKSTDRGKNWTKLPLFNVQSCHFFPNGSMLASTNDVIVNSLDDGEHWDTVFVKGTNFLNFYNKILSNSYSSAYIIIQTQPAKILSTIDYGKTWSLFNVSGLNSDYLDPINGQVANNLGYLFTAGIFGEIFFSVNEGHTFNLFSNELKDLFGLSIAPNQNLYAYSNYSGGLYRATQPTSNIKVLRGNVFSDLNFNCIKSINEIGKTNRMIKADNGLKKEFAYSLKNGDFSIPILTGNYDLSVETDNNYWSSCSRTIASVAYNYDDTLQLGLQVITLCPFMKVDIQSTVLRRCFESTIFINYSNTGTQLAKDAYVDVTLDSFFDFVSSTIPVSSRSGNVFRFMLGNVEENISGTFSIVATVSCKSALGQLHCAEAHIFPDTSCIQSLPAIVKTNSNCLGDSIDLIIKNVGSKPMSSFKRWSVIDLSQSNSNIQSYESGTYFLNENQVFTKRVESRDKILFIAEQDDSYPYNKTSKTEITSCNQNPIPGSPPLSINNLDEEEPFISKFCEQNRGSFDPNDIIGYPIGITNKKYIDKEQQLEYVIRFQNTGTDTAFNVRIENEIPTSELDLATLSLGASSHPYQFILSPEGKLIFSFSNIQLPDSNIHESASHGFVQYSIKPFDKLNNGTQILNDASIYFDFNAGVNTNVDFHTIGNPVIVKVNEVNEGEDVDFQIEPNPFSQFAKITITNEQSNQRYKLTCLDVHSKVQWVKEFTGNQTMISKEQLPTGVYLLILKSADGRSIGSGKMIVE
jgi:uncharacterized repeat protein (TIGR01451 family)